MGLLDELRPKTKQEHPELGTPRGAQKGDDESGGLEDSTLGGEYVDEGTRRKAPPPPDTD